MTFQRRILMTLAVIAACIGFDQTTKTIARHELPARPSIALIDKYFHLHYTENSGAMLSMGSDLSPRIRFWLFIVFGGFTMAILFTFIIFVKELRSADIAALSLVLGGGMGNLLDRLLKGGNVVDFMVVSIGPISTAIFNFADMMIMCGLAILLVTRIPWTTPKTPEGRKVETRPDS